MLYTRLYTLMTNFNLNSYISTHDASKCDVLRLVARRALVIGSFIAVGRARVTCQNRPSSASFHVIVGSKNNGIILAPFEHQDVMQKNGL